MINHYKETYAKNISMQSLKSRAKIKIQIKLRYFNSDRERGGGAGFFVFFNF